MSSLLCREAVCSVGFKGWPSYGLTLLPIGVRGSRALFSPSQPKLARVHDED